MDLVALEQNVLHIEGWVCSIKGGSVDDFIVCCGGKEFTEFELTKGIFSPDVKAAFFDIVEQLVQWAQQTITPRFPNFNFRKVDIYNHY